MQSIFKTSAISPETISQAGAGALLAAVGVVELWLAYGAAAWWYRCGASVVAAAGVFLLVRALAVIVSPLQVELAHRVPRWQRVTARKPAGRVLLAE